MTTFRAEWDWNAVDRTTFAQILDNYGRWTGRHSGADSPHASLWALSNCIVASSAGSSGAA